MDGEEEQSTNPVSSQSSPLAILRQKNDELRYVLVPDDRQLAVIKPRSQKPDPRFVLLDDNGEEPQRRAAYSVSSQTNNDENDISIHGSNAGILP